MQVGPFALDRLRHRPRTAPDVEDLASNRRQVRKEVAQFEAVHVSRTRPQWSGAPALGLVIERRQRVRRLVLIHPVPPMRWSAGPTRFQAIFEPGRATSAT